MIDIKELRRLAAAATPGPWQDGGHTVYEAEGNVNCPEMICKMMSIEDSAYIAASNPSAILSLLDHIEQQEAEIARLRKDAFRYRFLRDMMVFTNAGSEKVMRLRAKIPAPTHEFYSDWVGDKFDASVDKTIDASMADTSTQEAG